MQPLRRNNDEQRPLLGATTASAQSARRDGRPYGTALVLLVLLSTGANWSEACLGPLKSMLLAQLSINNAQFGVLSAATQLANTLIPLFVVWVDVWTPASVAIASTLCVCVGSLATALGASAASFTLLVCGRVLQGLGVIMVDTAATKLLVRWFRRRNDDQHDGGTPYPIYSHSAGLSLVISINFACDRLAATLSKASAVPLARHAGDHPAATFWCATAVSAVSLVCAIVYARVVQPHEPQSTSIGGPPDATRTRTSFIYAIRRTFTTLPTFFVFLAVTQFYQPIAVFNNLAADIIRWKGASPERAGYLASIGQVMPIVVAPLLGDAFDRYGHRMTYVPVTAVLLSVSFGMLLWSEMSPLLAMLTFSLANAINSPPYLCSLAILLRNDATFGCAWGVWKALMQSYQIIMNTTLGRVQDTTPGRGYERVLLVLLASKAIEFVWGMSYIVLDGVYMRGILRANDEQRRQIEARYDNDSRTSHAQRSGEDDDDGQRSSSAGFGLRPHRTASLFLAGYFAAIVVAAWACFFGAASSKHVA